MGQDRFLGYVIRSNRPGGCRSCVSFRSIWLHVSILDSTIKSAAMLVARNMPVNNTGHEKICFGLLRSPSRPITMYSGLFCPIISSTSAPGQGNSQKPVGKFP